MSNLRAITAAAVLLGLSACGDGGSAVETRERPTDEAAAPEATPEAGPPTATPATGGAPRLTASRRETVDEKVIRLFERNGADFGARTPDEYLDKVEDFTRRPPPGTERVERPNGDVLLYQASSNTFAVVSRDGAPRTMFKPREGAAYWAGQKAAAPTFGRARNSSGG